MRHVNTAMTIGAIFDFDGTITNRDTLLDFLVFSRGWPRVALGAMVLSPTLTLYALGVIDNTKAKEKVLIYFFSGMNAQVLEQIGREYAHTRIPRIIRPKAAERMQWHKREGHRVLIVTASPELWVKPWAESLGVEFVATRLEIVAGKLTGKIEGPNCYGAEKVKRVREAVDLESLSYVYAYGNSNGDREMLGLADESFYRAF